MKEDDVIEQVRRAREEIAARHNFDLKAIFDEARKEQAKSGRKVVSFAKRKKK